MSGQAPGEDTKAEIALGVSGSVALHRALDLCSELGKRGYGVQVLMTGSAQKLVSPLFFQALSHRRVHTDVFAGAGDDPYDHLGPARECALFAVAPATANVIARLAHGLADDPLTTCSLAYDGPRLIAPAMNWRMWAHAQVRSNVDHLREMGWEVVDPVEGDLACGEQGAGRLAPVAEIVSRIEHLLA